MQSTLSAFSFSAVSHILLPLCASLCETVKLLLGVYCSASVEYVCDFCFSGATQFTCCLLQNLLLCIY